MNILRLLIPALMIFLSSCSNPRPPCVDRTVVDVVRSEYRTVYVLMDNGETHGLYSPIGMREGRVICVHDYSKVES